MTAPVATSEGNDSSVTRWVARIAPSFPANVLDAVLWLAALSGLGAAVTGWLLSHEGGYEPALLDILFIH